MFPRAARRILFKEAGAFSLLSVASAASWAFFLMSSWLARREVEGFGFGALGFRVTGSRFKV